MSENILLFQLLLQEKVTAQVKNDVIVWTSNEQNCNEVQRNLVFSCFCGGGLVHLYIGAVQKSLQMNGRYNKGICCKEILGGATSSTLKSNLFVALWSDRTLLQDVAAYITSKIEMPQSPVSFITLILWFGYLLDLDRMHRCAEKPHALIQ